MVSTFNLDESEKNRIRGLHNLNKKRNYIFESCVSVDGRYIVLHDEVFDIHEQQTLGNLWDSIDVFKTIFNNISLQDDKNYQQIKESILNIPILENRQTLHELKNILLEWNFWEDTWIGSSLSSSVKSIQDAAAESYEGLKNFGVALSRGQWTEILTLLAKGVRFVFRKIKEALYSNTGMIIDGILVAMGITKVAQVIPWAIVIALDVYQIVFNDWPEEEKDLSMGMKLLMLGFDILGFVFSGGVALAAKTAFAPLKRMNPKQMQAYVSKKPSLLKLIKSMLSGLKKTPSGMATAKKTLSVKFPKGASFISTAMNYFTSIAQRFTRFLESLIGQKATSGIRGGAVAGGVAYGFEKGMEKLTPQEYGGYADEDVLPQETDDNVDISAKNAETLLDLTKDYGGKDPFD